MKATLIPVTIGATGTISKSLRQYLSNIKGKARNQGTTKKTAILGTAHEPSKITNVKVQSIFHGRNNITWSSNCKYRTAATLYTLVTWFVSGS